MSQNHPNARRQPPATDRGPAGRAERAATRRRSPARGRARQPRVPLDVDRIVDAAIAIADRDGIDAMTMRNVAAELGVGAMSLYWHVATKTELELLVRERILSEDADQERVTGDLRHDLAQFARALRAKIQRHPWVLQGWARRPDYEGTTPALAAGLFRHIETSLRIVEDLPLPPQAKAGIIAVVDDFALGFAMDEATGGRTIDQERGDRPEDVFGTRVDEAEYPLLARYVADRRDMPDADAQFEWGLQVLLDGIEVQIERARAATAP